MEINSPVLKVETKKIDPMKIFLAIVASLYFLWAVIFPGTFRFIDYINLVFHEAGHIVFFPFGYFMRIAGGTILQILIPIACALYFLFRKRFFAFSLLLFWVGESCLNVSVYAADARLRQLPLLGGDNTDHDWNIILSQLLVLDHTAAIAAAIRIAGTMVIFAAAYFSFKNATAITRVAKI